jgi:hypothetical protein
MAGINMKTAVKEAFTFIEEFYPGAKDIRLEEVSTIGPVDHWEVVVSFKTGAPATLSEVMSKEFRLYKAVMIDADTGTPMSLRSWGE